MESVSQWWWSLPHKEIESTLNSIMFGVCLVYILILVFNMPKSPSSNDSLGREFEVNKQKKFRKRMMWVCLFLAFMNLLRVPFGLSIQSESSSLLIGLLPLFLCGIWGMAAYMHVIANKSTDRLEVLMRELNELQRVENRTYKAEFKDVWPPNPEGE